MTIFLRSLIALIGLMLLGCTGGGQTSSVALPLSMTQPTFILFYTDN